MFTVRLCTDRLTLVELALSARPHIYTDSATLLRLAALLRVRGDDVNEEVGSVLRLVTQTALKVSQPSRLFLHTCSTTISTIELLSSGGHFDFLFVMSM